MILHVVYPESYGVWNSVAESAMRRLQLWPSFRRGSTHGECYIAVNNALHDVAEQIDTDLWILDSLWWLTEIQHEPQKHRFSGGEGSGPSGGRGSGSRKIRARNTFQCSNCFLTKPTSLRSSDPDRRLDCNPSS